VPVVEGFASCGQQDHEEFAWHVIVDEVDAVSNAVQEHTLLVDHTLHIDLGRDNNPLSDTEQDETYLGNILRRVLVVVVVVVVVVVAVVAFAFVDGVTFVPEEVLAVVEPAEMAVVQQLVKVEVIVEVIVLVVVAGQV